MKFYTLALCLFTLFYTLPSHAAVEKQLLHADGTHYALRLTLTDSGLEAAEGTVGKQLLRQEGMHELFTDGDPALIAYTFSLEIPATSDIICEYSAVIDTILHVDMAPTSVPLESDPDVLSAPNPVIYEKDAFFPAEIVSISDPAIMRNHRLVQVAITPYQYNPVTSVLLVYRELELDFRFEGTNTVNQVTHTLPPSPTFEQMLSNSVMNYQQMQDPLSDWDQNLGLEPILYIYPDVAEEQLEPLLTWKRQQGHTVYLANTADIGTTYAQIRSYIQEAYDNWDNPPVFVTLVGDASGAYSVAASDSYGDHQYSRLEGFDILGDIFVGRMSVENTTQLVTGINKQLSYERNPYMEDTEWYQGALLIAGSSFSGLSTIIANRSIKRRLLQRGFTDIDTCWYTSGCNTPTAMIQAFNEGILFFNYRGWLGMEGWSNNHVNQLNNGWMLPFAVPLTCGTGNFTNGTSFTEGFYRAGTPTLGRGAIAAIGMATSSNHTRYNNAIDLGIYGGIFDHGQQTAGESLFQGKFELWQAFPNNPADIANFSSWCNLIGDASLHLRTGLPRQLAVGCTETVPSGASALPLFVESEIQPLPGAIVTLYQETADDTIQITTTTAADGWALLPLENQLISGEAMLTVSGFNLYPYQQLVTVVDEDLHVDVTARELDDDNENGSNGNDDGQLNPGELIDLRLTLANLGIEQTATGITATLTTDDNRIELLQSETTVPDLAPGEESEITTQLLFGCALEVEVELPPYIQFTVEIATGQGDFTAAILLPLIQPLLNMTTSMVDPAGDGIIDLEETAELFIELHNYGDIDFPVSSALLSTDDPWLTIVTGEADYDIILPDGVQTNNTAFMVEALAGCFNGQLIPLQLILTSEGPQQSLDIELEVGVVEADDAMGPAAGIYYCFESDDIYYSQHPVYNWIEINEIGTELLLTDYANEQDEAEAILLPFEFVYFDSSFNQVTICSNGWIGFGDQSTVANFRNYPIPTSIGPFAMIAPFWDDLRVRQSGDPLEGVFYYYDEPNHRFIIEWYDLYPVEETELSETFQVVLYDQAFSESDNGDILFQYQEIINNNICPQWDNPFATVGIESPDQLQGLEYSYWDNYSHGATELHDELAILFTQERGTYSETDIWPPLITHIPLPWQEATEDPYLITAQIVDHSGIDNATLHWSYDNESFTTVSMMNSSGDTWTADVPGQDVGVRIYYYLEAVDASPQSNETTTPTYNFLVGEWQLIFADDMEQGVGDWVHSAAVWWIDQWHLSSEDYQSGSHSWKCGDTENGGYASSLDSRLLMPPFTVEQGTRLRFQHRIEAEVSSDYPDSACDGGIVEVTLDGSQWDLLTAQAGIYNKNFCWIDGDDEPATHPFPGGTPCFSGELDWQESTFSLFDYASETVQLRFRFGSDQGVSLEGWYIDDVVVEHFFPADAVVGADQPDLLPQTIELSQNYPNPFNPTTTIEYALRLDGPVQLAVFNLRGQQVMTLVDGLKPAGRHTVQFDGARLASGLYFYRLEAKGTVLTRKMMLVR
jgi:hypothetical protein